MANRLRTLDPQASPAAMFGAELRDLRLRRGLSLAALGRLVHVSGDLVGKIEKAERRPHGDLVARLDKALEAEGRLERLGREVRDDVAGQPGDVEPQLTADDVLPVLRTVIDAARADDHIMSERTEADVLVAHARAAERLQNLVGRADRLELRRSIAEAYQLAGWMTFDKGRAARAETLLTMSRDWADRTADPALTAYVLGPNLSFVSTYGGEAARGAGATLMPSTLALIRNIFHGSKERSLAIGIWASAASAGEAVGPVLGGFLLEHFWWGSLPAPAGLDSARKGNRVTSERSRWNRDSDGVLPMNTQVQLRLGLSELARAIFLAFEGDTLRAVNEYGDLTFDRRHATRPDARKRVQDWLGRKGTDALTESEEPPEIYIRAARALYWQRRRKPASPVGASRDLKVAEHDGP